MAKIRRFRKGGTLSKETAATKLQSFNRGKATRKHTKRLELYKKLPDDLQSVVEKKYKSIDVLKKENNKLLLIGAEEGNLRKVKYALDNYADIEAEDDDDGSTALMNASENGRTEIVRLLLEKGADVNVTNDYGQTALHKASENDHIEIVKFLLEKGADIEAKAHNGSTALILASKNGHIEVVNALLEAGADVDVTTHNGGSTALILASINGHIEIVKLLLAAGADIEAKNKYGQTALHYASTNDDTEVIELLEKAEKRAKKKLTKSRTPKYKDRRRKVNPDFDRRRRGGKARKTRRH